MKNKLILIATLLVTTYGQAFADNSVGCGLGSMIFKTQSLVSSTLRVTTNNLFLNQYFGVTSGTSGCSRHSIVQNEKSHVHFAEVNLEQISQEMAKGEGQYLAAFAFTLGCSDEAIESLGPVAKKNYDQIFPSENASAQDMLKNLGQTLRSDKSLSQNCSKSALI